MDYLVMECRYNFSTDADILFATNEPDEAIETAKDFGTGTVVVRVNRAGDRVRIFTTPYLKDLGIKG